MNPKRPIQVLAIFALLFGLAFAQSSGSRESLAADKLEIMELAARFENTFDAGDIEGHLATWADEMSFASPFGNYDSKDAYGEWVTAFLDVARASGGTRHLVTNHEIFVEGDEARMTAYLIILTQNPPAVAFTAVFSDDRLTRTESGWRFVHRTLQLDQDMSDANEE